MPKILSDAERKAKEEKNNELITRAESVIAGAKAENRELTDDEKQELAEIRDDVRKIKEFLKLDDDYREMLEMEKKPDNEPKEDEMEDNRACGAEQEKRALEQRAQAEEKAFEAFLRGKAKELRNDPTDYNMTFGNNGAVVPETIANKIIKKVYDICPILEKSDKYNIKGDLLIPYYDESSHAITVGYQQEFSTMLASSGDFTSVNLGGFLAGALSKISRTLINNAKFNIVDFVVDRMAYAIARFIEGELLNPSDPTNKVKGLSTVTLSVTAQSASAITADELIKVQDKVKDIYQQDAFWIMSSNTRTAIRLLKDEMGRYLLQDDISAPFGKTLLGKPVYVSDNMPEIATKKTVIYYGDMSGLATKFGEEINIQVLKEHFALEHADGVVGWFEFDSKVEDAQKISKLVMA